MEGRSSILFSFSGYIHLLRLREMGSEEKGRFYFRIQVLRRQRFELMTCIANNSREPDNGKAMIMVMILMINNSNKKSEK